jgi:hypothetical protein
VDCANSKEHYEESAELLANDRKVYQARSDALSKSRARQHVNRKPGIIRDFEGEKASATSYSKEPVPRNARIQVHSKVISPSRQLPSSTPNPGFSHSSEESETGSRMEQAEQKGMHALNPQQPASHQKYPQYQENRQSRLFDKTDQGQKDINFSQNTPPALRAPEQRQIFKSNQFSEIRSRLEGPPRPQQPPVTTHRPKIGQFSHSRQFEQGLSDGHGPPNRVPHSRQQPQQSVTLQSHQQPQFRPEPQTFSQNKEVNNDTKSHDHVRFLPSSEIEGQLPAETGSFVNSRGNKLSGINQVTDRQRLSQNRFQQKTYAESVRSQNTTLERPSHVKSVGVQVTDRGITDLPAKQSSPEAIREEVPFDDPGFQEPPSEEQFKDEDLFYLRGTSTENDLSYGTALTESSVQHSDTYTSLFEDDFKNVSGEMAPLGDLGFSKPPNDTQFKDEYVHGGHENKETQDYTEHKESAHIMDMFKSSTALPTVDYVSGVNSSDLSSNFPTRKSHRFYSLTTAQTPIMSEPRTVQNTESSTEELPDKDVLIRKNTSNPHIVISYGNDKDHFSDFPPQLLRNIDISTIRPMRSQSENMSDLLSTGPNGVFSTTEKSVTKKLEPIFVEIIDRGSSEPPVLKTYTVEELENRREDTGSAHFTDKDKLPSSNPEVKASRSHTLAAGDILSTVTEPSLPVTLSRRLTPPNELPYLTPVPDHTYSEPPTTVLPPDPLVSLSRILLPPDLVVSSDTHDKNKVSNIGSSADLSTFRATSESLYIGHATPINPVTLSRTLQPPFETLVQFNSGLSLPTIASTVEQGKQQHNTGTVNQDTFTRFEPFKAGRGQDVGTYRVPQEAGIAQDIFVTTESSTSATSSSEPTGTSALHVDIQYPTSEPNPVTWFPFKKQQTVTEFVQSTTPFLNISAEETTTEPDIPISLPLKQEPSASPQYKNRDGFAVPASSGPSTLHSLAVYFSIRDRNQDTTVDTLNTFYSDNLKVEGEKPTTESVPMALSTVYDITKEVNETDGPVLAPSFLTKPVRDSYSVLFPNTKEDQSSVTEQIGYVTGTAQISATIPKERKTSPSLHSALTNELLDKLAEISEMEAKPLDDRTIVSSQREVLHSDTEDLLQGTDSQDLRELAQIFSRALSAYLENPEGFKKALSEVRPKDPSSVYSDDGKEFESKQFLGITRSSVSSSTQIPLTSSTEYSSVTQEDEEVLDFSDVSKVSRRKSKSTTLMPPYSKSIKTEKWKSSVSTSYVNPTIVISSRKNGVIDTTSKSSSSDTVQDVDLKPPEEGLQNAQSTYYTSSKQQVPESPATVSPDTFESLQVTEEHGENYTLPFGTKQYDGPGYGAHTGGIRFAPTAGGVNDPSRPRYGGFQNNSGVTLKEVSTEVTDTQVSLHATTSVPECKHKARSTVKPVSVTPDVETISTEEFPAEIDSILHTFVPQQLNNLAVAGTPETPAALIYNENILKGPVHSHDLVPNSNEAVLGANVASFTSLPTSQPSDPHNLERKWSSLGNVVDALTINHELSESDVKQRASSAVAQELIPSFTTAHELAPTTEPVLGVRHRATSKSDNSDLAVATDGRQSQTSNVPYNCGTASNAGSSISPLTETNKRSQLEYESEFPNTRLGSSENSDHTREIRPPNLSDRTYYSEEIKPLPPPSASLIHVSLSRKTNVDTLNRSSEFPDTSDKISMITSSTSIPFNVQPLSTTPTYFPVLESKSISFQRKSGTDSYTQLLRYSQEPHVSRQASAGASKISVPSEKFLPASITETSPTPDTVIGSWKQETNQSKQEVSNVDLSNIESFTAVPLSNSIPPARGNTLTRRTKNTTIKTPTYIEGINVEVLKEDPFFVPNTSVSTLPLLDSSVSVIVTSGSNTLSRKKEPSEKRKSLNKEVISGDSNNASNSQNFVRINTVVTSTRSRTSTVPAVRRAFSSNQPVTSTPRTSSGTDVRMDDVTAEQLKALEDLQAMVFSTNTTAAKDGTMFSNLNESSTLSLISTMKEAVMNSTVRRLVLLLVNSLKENTPQETRKQLIEALLRMPAHHKPSDSQQDSVSTFLKERVELLSEEQSGKITSVTATKPDFENNYSSITEVPTTNLRSQGAKDSLTTTSEVPQVRTAARSKTRRIVRVKTTTQRPSVMPGVTSSLERHSQPKEGDLVPQSDTRAVELLQSLYSLASRWG